MSEITDHLYGPDGLMNPEPPLGGRKDDGGKVRVELFPGDALFAISQVLTFGANKYADRNWEKGMKWSRVFGALMRHMWCWWQGDDKDPETGFSHLWHAGACVVFLISYELRNTGTDDRGK
jgi:hypothetical protein